MLIYFRAHPFCLNLLGISTFGLKVLAVRSAALAADIESEGKKMFAELPER
jgi:hypothetical protein